MNMRIFQDGEEGGESLRQIATDLTPEQLKSPEIRELIDNLTATMRTAPGVGLAAPQIGVPLKVIVIEDIEARQSALLPEIRHERGRRIVNYHVMINPKLIVLKLQPAYFFEGCLSVKGFMRVTPRAEEVTVRYLDERGVPQELTAQGWYARILQHEIDHLNGRLYVDFAHECTELKLEKNALAQWTNATRQEIMDYYQKCMQAKEPHQNND
jgi:peptide deformylase